MTNSFYNVSGAPVTGSTGSSAVVRGEFANIAAAFDKMPALTAGYVVTVNAGGTALTVNAKTGTGSVVFDTSPNFTGPVGIGMSPTNILDITQTQNAASIVQIYSGSSGAAAQTMFRTVNDSSKQMSIGMPSSGFTTSGLFAANRGFIYSTAQLLCVSNGDMHFSCDGGTTGHMAITSTGIMEKLPVNWIDSGGTVNAITATYSPAISSVVDGLELKFRATGANTSTTPTFSPNGLTARTIVKAGGQALLEGDIPRDNYECTVRYYAASTQWELLNPASTTNRGFANSNNYAASGMPGNFSLSVSGSNKYLVTVQFFGKFQNTNATPLTPRVQVSIYNDGGASMESHEWSTTVASGYDTTLSFIHTFLCAAPASGAFAINVTDTESDGGSHNWSNCHSSAGVVSI